MRVQRELLELGGVTSRSMRKAKHMQGQSGPGQGGTQRALWDAVAATW